MAKKNKSNNESIKSLSQDQDDRVKCYLCGKWFRTISWSHLYFIHGITGVDEYKERFDLTYVAAPSLRKNISIRNTQWTREKVILGIRELVKNGEFSNYTHISLSHPCLQRAGTQLFGSWPEAVKAAGFDYKKICPERKAPVWSKELIIEKLLAYKEQGVPLNVGNVQEKDLLLYQAACRYFSSWGQALEAIGVDYSQLKKEVQLNRSKYTKEEVLTTLLSLYREGQLSPAKTMLKTTKGSSLVNACRKYFGSFQAALEAVGIDYQKFLRQRRKWDEDKVKDAVRNYYEEDILSIIPRDLYTAARRYFGSWPQAVQEAGLDYDSLSLSRRCRVWSKEQIVSQIISYHRKGIELNSKAVGENDVKLKSAAIHHFGSWKNALSAAGLDYDEMKAKRVFYTREEILILLRSLYENDKLLPATQMKKSPEYSRLYNACTNHYKSFQRALEAAGIDYQEFRRKQNKWNKDKILSLIRFHYQEEKPGCIPADLKSAARRLFGSWRKALSLAQEIN